MQHMYGSGCLLSLAWLAVFPVLKTVVCPDSSEHHAPAAFWRGTNSGARRDPGEYLETVCLKQILQSKAVSVWGEVADPG